MKARVPKQSPLEQRKKGRELIKKLREEGYSDYEICRKIGVPIGWDEKFLSFVERDNIH